MKFHIYRTSSIYIKDKNFRYKPCASAYDGGAREWWYEEHAALDRQVWRVNLNSLEDLAKLQREVQCELVIKFIETNHPDDCDGTIEIYDYPRE